MRAALFFVVGLALAGCADDPVEVACERLATGTIPSMSDDPFADLEGLAGLRPWERGPRLDEVTGPDRSAACAIAVDRLSDAAGKAYGAVLSLQDQGGVLLSQTGRSRGRFPFPPSDDDLAGTLVPALYDLLAQEAGDLPPGEAGRLLIHVDTAREDLAVEDLLRVVYTTSQAGFADFALTRGPSGSIAYASLPLADSPNPRGRAASERAREPRVVRVDIRLEADQEEVRVTAEAAIEAGSGGLGATEDRDRAVRIAEGLGASAAGGAWPRPVSLSSEDHLAEAALVGPDGCTLSTLPAGTPPAEAADRIVDSFEVFHVRRGATIVLASGSDLPLLLLADLVVGLGERGFSHVVLAILSRGGSEGGPRPAGRGVPSLTGAPTSAECPGAVRDAAALYRLLSPTD